jgi:hypothetical protein
MVLRLVVAVLHYMFRPTWPSSGVYDVSFLYSWRNLLRCATKKGKKANTHTRIRKLTKTQQKNTNENVHSITTCKKRQQKQRSRFLQEYKSETSYTPENGHVGRNIQCRTATTKRKTISNKAARRRQHKLKTYCPAIQVKSSNSQTTYCSMVIADYVSVCVQLYCILVFTVFHYMFRPTWPSKVCRIISIFLFICLKDSASLLFCSVLKQWKQKYNKAARRQKHNLQ